LANSAKTESDAEADRLLAEAGAKYQAALEMKPDMEVALANLGATLVDRAARKIGDDYWTLRSRS
jgi:hypothetical protein